MSSSPLDLFDRVYVINLRERKDRRRETTRELRRLDHAESQITWFEAVRDTETHGFPSPGTYGAFQSHTGVLEDAVRAGLRRVLIPEDDIMFSPLFEASWDRIQDELQSTEWDLVNLGFSSRLVTPTAATGLIPVSEHIVTAHCYAVHQRVLGRLTEFLRTIEQRERHHPLGGRMHFDGALNVFCDQNPDVRRFRPSQNLVMQRSSKSDIAGPSRFDRHRTTRMAVRAARAMKNRLRRRRVTGAAGS